MGIFQGKIWTAVFILIGIILMVREGQFGNAIATIPQLFGQPVQLPPVAPAPIANVQPIVVPAVQAASVPQIEPAVSVPAAPAPIQQKVTPDHNRYVVKNADHLWEVRDGQMVQTDELPKGVIVEYLGPYLSTTNYTEVAELDTNGAQIKTGAILSASIVPISDFSPADEPSIASNPPSTIFLTIQSVSVVGGSTSPPTQMMMTSPPMPNEYHRALMAMPRSYPRFGCCRPPQRQNPSVWPHPVRPAAIIRSRYATGQFHVSNHRESHH